MLVYCGALALGRFGELTAAHYDFLIFCAILTYLITVIDNVVSIAVKK